GCVTPNEWRLAVLSLPPIDGGDELATQREERMQEEAAKQQQAALEEQAKIEDKRAQQAGQKPGDDASAEEGMNEEDEEEKENTPAGRAARAQNKREPAKQQEKKKPKAKKAALLTGPGGDQDPRPFGRTSRFGIKRADYEALWLKAHGRHEGSFAKVLEKLFADQLEATLARLRRVR